MLFTQDMAAPAIISTSDSILPEEEIDGNRLCARWFVLPTGSTPIGRVVPTFDASGRRIRPANLSLVTVNNAVNNDSMRF